MAKIIRARVENILGAKEIELAPEGKNLTVGGANRQGKSSALNAIIMALAGKSKIPQNPIHRDAESGSVLIELDDLIVELQIRDGRESSLTLRSKDGKLKLSSPQKILNDMFHGLSFDPGKFKGMNSRDQVALLAELIGVDVQSFDDKRSQLFDLRRDIGRQGEQEAGAAAAIVVGDNVPDAELDVVELSNAIREMDNANREAVDVQHEIAEVDRDIRDAEQLLEQLRKRAAELRSNPFAVIPYPEATIEAKKAALQNSADVNAAVREKQKKAEHEKRAAELRDRYAKLTAEIRAIDESKAKAIADADLPIAGLSFADGSVIFNGTPLDQCCESEQWEVSTAIGFALSRGSILIMSNCGGLDRKARDRVRSRAEALGVQLLLEVVDDADDVEVLIEEGEVKEDRTK